MKVIAGFVLVALVGAGGWALGHPSVGNQKVGSLPGPDISSSWLCVGGSCEWTLNGQCPTGANATSTIASIANPWAATSTLEYFSITGTQGATTTDIVVGTSTSTSVPSGLTNAGTTTIAENIMGMTTIGTSTQFASLAGFKLGPGTGYTRPDGTAPGAANAYLTNAQVMIGPLERVLVFSTSTYFDAQTGATGASQIAVPAACNWTAIFRSTITH